jgi:hypothetical protein
MMEWLTQLLLVLPLMKFSNTLPDVIRIGGLFHPADDKQEIAFRYAVEKINSDRMILPRSKLNAQIEKMSPQDSFHASKKVCHLLRSGVAAIFGPQSAHTASHVQSICDTMEIPHLETRWDYRLRRESCLVNLYPHPTTLSKVRLRHLESLEIRLRKFGKCSRLESISWVNSPDWWSARGELIPKLSPFPVIGTGLTGSHHQSII